MNTTQTLPRNRFGLTRRDIDLAVMNPDISDATMRCIKTDFEDSSLPYMVDILRVPTLTDNAVKDHIMRVEEVFF